MTEQAFLPFAKPDIDQAAIDEVVACLQSGWITTGPRVNRFEQDLTAYLEAQQVLCVNSATAGLHLALLCLNLQPGDEIITTPLTFVATLNTIVQAGGIPVLVDVDLHTYNINVENIAAAITPRTRGIVPVHYAGLPVDLDPIYQLAEQHQLTVIEDCAHSIGAAYKGKRLGSFGHMQVFSFHPNKNMTTGEGGAISCPRPDWAAHISAMRFHGISKAAFDRFSKQGTQHYDVIAPGFKYNMLDMQAAIGIHQLPRLDSFIAARTRIAKRYLDAFADWPELQLPQAPDYAHTHAWHLFAPLINTTVAGMNRDEFMQRLKDMNIGTGLHYEAVHLHPFYQETYGFRPGDFPIAEDIGNRIVSLPLFPSLTESEQTRVIDSIAHVFAKELA
ncbi:MAG: DegT/DnrJ/EryC1/StrS aminotransferase family protein [Pseudomonadota bacterium]|nr:DegT/DnrJ/EryC1/StrS aminotransferase family protein [Pseudomonadota bacterium]